MNYHPSMAGIEAKTCVGKLLVELEYGECKFAVGEDDEGRHLFCSAETQEGQSYCCDHRIIAFQYAPEPRRRSFDDADARLLLSRQATARICQIPSLPQVRRAAVSRMFDAIQPAPQIEGKKSRPFVSPFTFQQIFERAEKDHPLPEPFAVEASQTRSKQTQAAIQVDPPDAKSDFPKVQEIQEACSAQFGISVLGIISERRSADFIEARHVAIYLCSILTPHSLPEIGRRFGNRDHTTILHAIRKIEKLMKDGADPLRQIIDELTASLLASGGKTKTHEGAR